MTENVALTPAAGTTISGSSQVLINSACTYRGFSLKETAGASAAVTLWDNASAASGPILEVITLAANESARELYESGMPAFHGVYVQIVSGSVAGIVRTS